MKMNQPTVIGLTIAAIVLAIGVIMFTLNANTVGPPPPMAAGIAPPDGNAKVSTPAAKTSPGMALPTPGTSLPTPGH